MLDPFIARKLLPEPSLTAYGFELKRKPIQTTILIGRKYRAVTLICLLLFLSLGLLVSRVIYSSQEQLAFQKTMPTPFPSPLATPTPLSKVPAEFIVPKLNIRANVEQVGQTRTLQMDVPKNAADVAWYVYGAKPGEAGNVVINGHYDTPSGRPAIFYTLNSLVVGDTITLISEYGEKSTYTVSDKKLYPTTDFPSEYIFHTKPGNNLNIVTCAGIWNQIEHIYNKRLVVYATLNEDKKGG